MTELVSGIVRVNCLVTSSTCKHMDSSPQAAVYALLAICLMCSLITYWAIFCVGHSIVWHYTFICQLPEDWCPNKFSGIVCIYFFFSDMGFDFKVMQKVLHQLHGDFCNTNAHYFHWWHSHWMYTVPHVRIQIKRSIGYRFLKPVAITCFLPSSPEEGVVTWP